MKQRRVTVMDVTMHVVVLEPERSLRLPLVGLELVKLPLLRVTLVMRLEALGALVTHVESFYMFLPSGMSLDDFMAESAGCLLQLALWLKYGPRTRLLMAPEPMRAALDDPDFPAAAFALFQAAEALGMEPMGGFDDDLCAWTMNGECEECSVDCLICHGL